MVKPWMVAVLLVPLGAQEAWQQLSFRGIPRHRVHFDGVALDIDVCRSAMPLVHRLIRPVAVTRVRVQGRIRGLLKVTAAEQGRRGFDDFALRLGLVEAGPRRLGRLERLVAPAWLRTLFGLAPPGTGITRVRFLAVGVDRTQVGQTRTHPMHELLEEHIVTAPAPDGTFVIDEPIVPPAVTLGVWLAADGDDTGSCYTLSLDRIELDEGAPSGEESPTP